MWAFDYELWGNQGSDGYGAASTSVEFDLPSAQSVVVQVGLSSMWGTQLYARTAGSIEYVTVNGEDRWYGQGDPPDQPVLPILVAESNVTKVGVFLMTDNAVARWIVNIFAWSKVATLYEDERGGKISGATP